MSRVYNIMISLATSALLSSITGLTTTTAADGYDRCPKGEVCFFSDRGGGGYVCSWDSNAPNWLGGFAQCTDFTIPRSVYNNGYVGNLDDVVYYTGANYQNRIGCTGVGIRGDLTDTYTIRSHRWVKSC